METKLVARLIESARTVTPLVAVSATTLDPQAFRAGETLRAQVAARLADGSFRVVVDGKSLKLALPADTKPGDVVQLSVHARPGGMTMTSAAAAAAAGEELSGAGQLIASLAAQPPAKPAPQTRPIVAVPSAAPSALLEPLARAVERSGVFYESHQARWASGSYPLERLLEEPQGALARRAAVPAPEPAMRAAARGAPDEPAAPGESGPPAATAVAAKEVSNLAKAEQETGQLVARDALPLVRQQLDVLEQRQLTWLGELWPGQSMRWEIGELAGQHGGGEDAPAWSSRFGLSLPALGEVGAELVLVADRLRIRLTAANAHSEALMRSASAELVQALQAAGIAAVALKVQCDDAPV
ncbi:MAG: flagellar hook-length control protein FliK [Burkholderiales bacterium]|nr:flagellar hook-length control protein FliK [Burkholderiales bacterium]